MRDLPTKVCKSPVFYSTGAIPKIIFSISSHGSDAGSWELASYEYNDYNGKLKKLTYSNGLVVEYLYNALENLPEVWYTVTDEEGNTKISKKQIRETD